MFELLPAPEPEHLCADIVVIEPDPRAMERLYARLDAEGHRVRTAGDLASARLHLARRRPQFLIAAARVGERDAVEFLPALAAEGLLPKTVVTGVLPGSPRALELGAISSVFAVISGPYDALGIADTLAARLALPDGAVSQP